MERTSGNLIKAIVFDWDGVLDDSMPMIAIGIQETAASYGVHLSVETILATYFQPKEDFYKSVGIDIKNKDELQVRHSANDRKRLVLHPKLFSDVVPTLEALRDKGLVLGIATQRTGDGMIKMQNAIEENKLQTLFPLENIEGGPKTKEEKLVALIERFRIAPSELLFVGDLPSDITSAGKAGVKSAAIARHSPIGSVSAPVDGQAARLKALKPDYFLDSLADLLAIF